MPQIYDLTDDQKQKIIDHWNSRDDSDPPSFADLIELICEPKEDGSYPDGREKEGKAIRKFLASKSLRARRAGEYLRRKALVLSDDNKQYIDRNTNTMKAYEMAEVIYEKKPLTNLSFETKAVLAYKREKGAEASYGAGSNRTEALESYKSPRNDVEIVAKIKRFAEKIRPDFIVKNLTPIERKNILGVLEFMRTERLVQLLNTYETEEERALFESTFVRLTWTKPDLLPEEVDEYIVYASEVVNGSNIMSQIKTLRRARDEEMGVNGKVPMSIVEAVAKTQAEYNNCIKRQESLLKALKTTRAQRLSQNRDESATLGNLVALFQAEETRKQMIEVAKKRQFNQEEEYDKIKTVDDIKSKMVGLTRNEGLYG